MTVVVPKDDWPIRLETRKQNIKKGREQRQLTERIFSTDGAKKTWFTFYLLIMCLPLGVYVMLGVCA